MIDTNESLLERVRRVDAHEAWREFYLCYASAILRYARKLGLDQHRAEEVLQETMVALMRQLPAFRYDRRRGKFRNFLLTIVHRKSMAAFRRSLRTSERHRDQMLSDPTFWLSRGSEADPQEQAARCWHEALMEDALGRLAADAMLQDGTYPVFHAYVIEGRDAADVAREFQIAENAVYQIKNRLLRRLRAEVARRMRDSGITGERAL